MSRILSEVDVLIEKCCSMSVEDLNSAFEKDGFIVDESVEDYAIASLDCLYMKD